MSIRNPRIENAYTAAFKIRCVARGEIGALRSRNRGDLPIRLRNRPPGPAPRHDDIRKRFRRGTIKGQDSSTKILAENEINFFRKQNLAPTFGNQTDAIAKLCLGDAGDE